MTKEELEKEAKAYAFNHYGDTDIKGDCLADDVIMEQAYLAAAEPRENRIAELEKENKELCDNYNDYKAVAEPEIDRLNKECGKLEGKIQDWTSEYYELENFMNNKLAEAKEIIKDLLGLKSSISSAKDAEGRFNVREKAKKFLEEKE